MTQRLRHQIAATLLALCVAMSGFFGINPTLHRLVEHAGDGSAHVHRNGVTFWHDHGHDHPHRHEGRVATSFPLFDKRLEHVFQSHPFVSLPVREVLALLLESWAGDDVPEEPHTGHQHHSLAQSLGDGLVESAYYESRLPGEPVNADPALNGGYTDVHFHPVEPIAVRVGLTARF